MNKIEGLVKLAKKMSKEERDKTGNKVLAGAAGAAVLGSMAPSRLLGYHNVYHGNSSPKANRDIKKHGLKTSHGGTGSSVVDDAQHNAGTSNNVKRSKNHVYFSKNKQYAKQYTANMFTGPSDHLVVHGRMPHNQYRKAKEDSLYRKLMENKGVHAHKDAYKSTSAMSNHGIPSSRISGGAGDKGAAQFATKKNMKRYLKSTSGKLRFASGVGAAGLAAGSAAYSAHNVKKLVDNARSKS